MVVWNSTEAEFNTKDGEVILCSRHTLAVNNSRKIPKIVGAISILLIQDGESVHPEEIPQLIRADGSITEIDKVKDGESSSHCIQNPKITIPASLSFVPMPSLLLGKHLNPDHVANLQDIHYNLQQPKLPDSEKASVPRYSENYQQGNVPVVQESVSSPEQFVKSNREVSFLQNSSSHETFPYTSINGGNENVCDQDVYIKVEPRSEHDEDIEYNSAMTSNWTGQEQSLLSSYDPSSNSMKSLSASELSTNSKYSVSVFPEQNFTSTTSVKKEEKQQSFYKLKLPKLKHKKSRKFNPQQRPKNLNSKNIPRCAECSQCLSSYKELINHNAMHGKTSECPVCRKYFTTRGSFVRHSIAHMQKRSFPCPYCCACFTRKDNLKRHFNVNHKNANWKPSDSQSLEEKLSLNSANMCTTEIGLSDPEMRNESEPCDENATNFQPSVVFPMFITRTSTSPPSLAKHDTKTSNLNTIVNNLHGKKAKLPLLRSILTSPKGSGSRKPFKNHVVNMQENEVNLMENGSEQTQISYMCSECNIGFSSLADMKCHIVKTHGEETPNELETLSNDLVTHLPNENEGFIELGSNILSQVYLPLESSKKARNELLLISANKESKISDGTHSSQTKGYVENQQKESGTNKQISDSNCLQKASELIQDSAEIDIESWVKNCNVYNDMNLSERIVMKDSDFDMQEIKQEQIKTSPRMNFNSSSTYLVPSQIPISSAIPDNRTYFTSPPFVNVGNGSNNRCNTEKSATVEIKPRKRRITLQSELTVCRLCGMYLESGSHIVQHGTQQHRGEVDTSTCIVCFTKLSGYDSLYRHCQLHFGVMFSCQYCSSQFTRKDNLTRHVKNTHGGNRGLNDTL